MALELVVVVVVVVVLAGVGRSLRPCVAVAFSDYKDASFHPDCCVNVHLRRRLWQVVNIRPSEVQRRALDNLVL